MVFSSRELRIAVMALVGALSTVSCSKEKEDDSSDTAETEETDAAGGGAGGTKTKQPGGSGGGGTTAGTDGATDDDEDEDVPLPPIGPVAKLELTGPTTPNNCACLPLKLTAKNASNETIRAEGPVDFSLTETSANVGGLYSDSSCGVSIHSGTFAQNSSETTLYYANILPVPVNVSVQGTSISASAWSATLTAPTPASVTLGDYLVTTGYAYGTFNPPNGCAGPFYFDVANPSGYGSYLILSTSPVVSPITLVNGDVQLYPSATCTAGEELSALTIPANTVSSSQFWVKGSVDSDIDMQIATPAYTAHFHFNY